jgi:DeoR/GlpR family transcriptional regulator of sugar metabolism
MLLALLDRLIRLLDRLSEMLAMALRQRHMRRHKKRAATAKAAKIERRASMNITPLSHFSLVWLGARQP